MLLEMVSENRNLRLKEDLVDFSYTENGRLSEEKQVTVENKYPFDV